MTDLTSTSNAGPGHLEMPERALSVVVGLSLAAVAARPRPNHVLSILVLGAGVFLAYRGATGNCPIRAALDV